jgi:hypothetical protein
LIIAAINENANVIHPALSSVTSSSFIPSSHPAALSGLLALHIRRGDYVGHCRHLAKFSSRYMGFNEFPGLPDRFSPPEVPSAGIASTEKLTQYRAHCFPEIAQIVARVREVRTALLPATPLSRVYVLTNGRPEWLAELKDALQADARESGFDAWTHIGTSRDLRLTREQKHNVQAMDMAVAQLADVFLGNGVSLCVFLNFYFLVLIFGDIVFDYDVECGHASRGTRLRVEQDALLVRLRVFARPLDLWLYGR